MAIGGATLSSKTLFQQWSIIQRLKQHHWQQRGWRATREKIAP